MAPAGKGPKGPTANKIGHQVHSVAKLRGS